MIVMEEKKKSDKKSKNENHQWIVDTIERLVKPPINFPREYKLMKELLAAHKDKRIFSNINFMVNSLAFFKTPKGINELTRIKNSIKYIVKRNKHVELEKEKIGEDIIMVDKVMTIREFLNKYK